MKLVNPCYHIEFFNSHSPNKETYHTIKTKNIFFIAIMVIIAYALDHIIKEASKIGQLLQSEMTQLLCLLLI